VATIGKARSEYSLWCAQGALQTRAREIAPPLAPAAESAALQAGALYDDFRLEWTETHDDSSHSQGVLGLIRASLAFTAPRSTATAPASNS